LPELIAERGEEIVITRDGREVVRLSALDQKLPKPAPQEMADWFRTHPPIGTVMPAEDAATLVRRMRDEDWAR
jgi:antitoxin (DNA-binding transcriptional repressor) of toxin-antitoxin stability system